LEQLTAPRQTLERRFPQLALDARSRAVTRRLIYEKEYVMRLPHGDLVPKSDRKGWTPWRQPRTATRGLAVLALILLGLGFGLVHANAASAQTPVSMTLTPPFDQNPVRTFHTVTASVTCLFPFFTGPCPAGEAVTFQVSGANFAGGTTFTNGAGQASFTYFGTNVGPDTITARAGAAFGQATKVWIAGPPRSITLTPPNDTNTVGTPHTVTATVRDQFGNPVPGDLVTFSVSRVPPGGNPVPAGGSAPTNGSGQATFTYTNTVVGTDTITARETIGGGLTAQASKRWVARPPTRLTLNPATATNPVGTQHCVTATVTDGFGNPTPNITVQFSVSGSVTTSSASNTNASGQATFCYTGPPLPGEDAIHAYADSNPRNGTQDPGEPFGDATKTWILPVSTPGCEVKITNGGWIIASNGDKSSFGGNAKVDLDGNVSGNEEYQDHGPAQPMNLNGNVLVVICTSTTQATIYGQATIDGTGSFFYRLNVEDNAEPGKDADKYWILVDNGYDSGNQTLMGGNVQIHKS
jgi:hypothetical protein